VSDVSGSQAKNPFGREFLVEVFKAEAARLTAAGESKNGAKWLAQRHHLSGRH